ncbi:hypothetical protein BUALT_Bualt19G0043200 [Buddleja alternifolia]|uniref:Serine carboxypeptidase n=1 Tax=Buddleja alternifolia TaxID=168488 RepID=A0AAV6W5F8_9LAMI|nr:hypothetical protein BUALT_Bualt19G0043200 [Buddleja alternifolia]
MKNKAPLILFFSTLLLSSSIAQICGKKQTEGLSHLYKEKLKNNTSIDRSHLNATHYFNVAKLHAQERMKVKDGIERLPGQPQVKFKQYGGYVTVNRTAGRAFYYYFVEAEHSEKSLPLLLWLNGGPGCSSLGYGAMQEIGPFRVESDGKTLHKNNFAWNHAANVLFLESPAGIGNPSINNETDVKRTYEYFASHALISDETSDQILKYCDFSPDGTELSDKCSEALHQAKKDVNHIDIYNI